MSERNNLGLRRVCALAGALCLLCLAGLHAASDVRAAGPAYGTIHSFYAALRNYYRVPEVEITRFRESGISYEELPVVFFIAETAHAEISRVIELRSGNRQWTEVAFRLGLTPDVFYVPLTSAPADPPYSRPYSRYSNRPKREWKTVSLSDKDVINLVNLEFISENCGAPPEQVIRMRSQGRSFLEINEKLSDEMDRR